MKIGILGGSFNPIHIGHLLVAQNTLEKASLDKILFVPTGKSPHKEYNIRTSDRVKMVNLAIQNSDDFDIELFEAQSSKVIYTIDTLKFLRRKYPTAKLYFIIGTDNLIDIKNWKDVKEYYKYTEILLADRLVGNVDVSRTVADLWDKYNLKVQQVKTPIVEISSTGIREKIKAKKSIKYMCSDKVVEYIEKHRLYQ